MEEYGTLHAEPIKVGKYKGHKYFVNMNQFLWLNGYAEIPEKLERWRRRLYRRSWWCDI